MKAMREVQKELNLMWLRMGLISLKEAAEDTGMQLEEFAARAAKTSSY